MVVKILLLYSNGNMLAQKFKLRSDKLCILVFNRDLVKILNSRGVLCFYKGSRWFRMYKSKS